MTADASTRRTIHPETFVPVLAFGTTLAAVVLRSGGLVFEIQYAAVGGFLASCLLAYLAWMRAHKDIVALSTPVYGFIFLVTPIEYAPGIALQLVYAAGLTILAARLRRRFGTDIIPEASSHELPAGPLRTYVESTRPFLVSLAPAFGSVSADAFMAFSAGEYARAAEISHAGMCLDGIPEGLAHAFSIVRQHAELLESGQPCPLTFQKFTPADSAILAKTLQGPVDPKEEFELMLDNALLLLFSAAWHASPGNRSPMLASRGFAGNLIRE